MQMMAGCRGLLSIIAGHLHGEELICLFIHHAIPYTVHACADFDIKVIFSYCHGLTLIRITDAQKWRHGIYSMMTCTAHASKCMIEPQGAQMCQLYNTLSLYSWSPSANEKMLAYQYAILGSSSGSDIVNFTSDD